jgi:hypothetical protein
VSLLTTSAWVEGPADEFRRWFEEVLAKRGLSAADALWLLRGVDDRIHSTDVYQWTTGSPCRRTDTWSRSRGSSAAPPALADSLGGPPGASRESAEGPRMPVPGPRNVGMNAAPWRDGTTEARGTRAVPTAALVHDVRDLATVQPRDGSSSSAACRWWVRYAKHHWGSDMTAHESERGAKILPDGSASRREAAAVRSSSRRTAPGTDAPRTTSPPRPRAIRAPSLGGGEPRTEPQAAVIDASSA